MQGTGIVKSVLSGDTVLLMSTAATGVASEMQLSLAFCQAPRIARTAEGIQEYFGWESREYLRKMIIGKVVKFKVLYKVDVINRTFGTLELNGKDIVQEMVSSGYVSVRSERDSHNNPDLLEDLLELQSNARDNHVGIWSSHKYLRPINWTISDPETYFLANKGMPMAAQVEQVRDGNTLKLFLLETNQMITLRVAGIQCPRITYSSDGNATYEAFAAEARAFTEIRLLNRNVVITIDGKDKFDNFFGRVEHPCGSLVQEVLEAGLARVVDWSASFLPTEEVVKLRAAEMKAKKANLRLWKDWKPINTTYAAIDGQVLQVLSGDTLIILLEGKDPLSPSSQRRVNLASIRAPKIGNAKKNVADEPWANEAKNHLIKLAIGKKVKMVVEYERTSLVGVEEQTFTHCSVDLANGTNLSEAMVKEGLAQVARHRDDEPRAYNYDQLLMSETEAKAAKKNMHGKKSPATRQRVDFSENPTKAKTNLHFLRRSTHMKAFVEYVFSASHYLIYIPEENCQFSLNLQGVKSPMSSGKAKAETYGDESLMVARQRYLQRNVQVEVLNVDKGGNYVGNIYLQGSNTPLVMTLLKEGLVYINEAAIDFCQLAEKMEEAEEMAKKGKKGYWKNYVEEVKPKELVVSGEMDIAITHIASGDMFYAIADADQPQLRTIENHLRVLPIPNDRPVLQANKGGVYACLTGMGASRRWERVRVIANNGATRTVYCLDTGRTINATPAQLHEIDATVKQIPPLARACKLAGIEAPPTGQWAKESQKCLDELADSDGYHVHVVMRDSENRLVLFLYREGDPDISLNEMMLSEGWARIEKTASTKLNIHPNLMSRMRNYEMEAKEDRVGIFSMGDIGFETDD